VWLPLSVFALVVWAVQRLRSKVALQDLGTGKFYLLSAIVSPLTYAPYLALRPPARSELLPAFGLAFLMAVTFGVTTEAIRRGPLGTVSPITALSPALTAVLAILVLHEHIGLPAYLGVALAPAGIVLLSLGRQEGKGQTGWRPLAVASLVLQGVGAFVDKLVVAPGPGRPPCSRTR
jgi:bacterial/archaeal transporter family protein